MNFIFQSKKSNFHKLSEEIEVLLRGFAANFVEADTLDQATAAEIYDEEFVNNASDVPRLGLQTAQRLQELVEEGTIDRATKQEFFV